MNGGSIDTEREEDCAKQRTLDSKPLKWNEPRALKGDRCLLTTEGGSGKGKHFFIKYSGAHRVQGTVLVIGDMIMKKIIPAIMGLTF